MGVVVLWGRLDALIHWKWLGFIILLMVTGRMNNKLLGAMWLGELIRLLNTSWMLRCTVGAHV